MAAASPLPSPFLLLHLASSRCCWPRSFLAGFYNNILGMVGFVKEGYKGRKNFDDRIGAEAELMEKVAARKAAKLAKQAGKAEKKKVKM